MSELETLRPVLLAIPSARLRAPGMPMAVALQEAHDLHATLTTGDTWARVVAVGVEVGALEGFGLAVAAARQAQSRWVVVRDRSKPGAQRQREAAARRLRAELLAACRFHLRDHVQAHGVQAHGVQAHGVQAHGAQAHGAQVRGVLEHVTKGSGVPDLVEDLLVLATLVDRNLPAFEVDETFDAPAQAEAARSAAAELAAGLSEARLPDDRLATRLLRDQAFTHLATRVAALREAGRYAFRHEPERAAAFASDHRRGRARKRRRARAKGRRELEEAVRAAAE